MTMRLIPFSIAMTIVSVFWLGSIIHSDWEASAEENPVEEIVDAPAPADLQEPMVSSSDDITATLVQADRFKAVFSTKGGALKNLILSSEQYARRTLVEDKGGYGYPEEKRAPGPLDLVTTWDSEFYPFQETFQNLDWIDSQDKKEAIVLGGEAGTARGRQFGIVNKTDTSVTFVWPNPATSPQSEFYIEKSYTLRGDFSLDVQMRIFNFSTRKVDYKMDLEIFGWQEPAEQSFATRPDLSAGSCRVSDETEYEEFTELADEDGAMVRSGEVDWVGLSTRYFILAAIPRVFPASLCDLRVTNLSQNSDVPLGLMEVRLRQNQTRTLHPEPEPSCVPSWLPKSHAQSAKNIPSCNSLYKVLSASPGQDLGRAKKKALIRAKGDSSQIAAISAAHLRLSKPTMETFQWSIYAGPKDIDQLQSMGKDAMLSDALDFGVFGIVSRPMLHFLRLAHEFLFSWALAIVFLTILIKLLFYPLTRKSFVQMKKMQELKPEMDKVKEKYGDDKQKMNTEMFALYKRHNVNPLGGCLPMVVQMPVYFALYETLYASVSLYQEPLFGWVTDLTSPDPYYILPLFLGATMFLQQTLVPTTMDSQQAKMMKYIMPVMFTGFMLFLPSGLVLYIFTNTVLSLVQQYMIHKKPA